MRLRIGLAYNPRPAEGEGPSSEDPPSEEPPSRLSHAGHAEWDDPSTVAAVEAALERAGEVIRLEADAKFPQRLQQTRPHIVFNIAEGRYGPNRRAHVPAICEFYDTPYTASDPLAFSLAVDRGRAKEVFLAHGVTTAAWAILSNGSQLEASFEGRTGPWVVKPVFETSTRRVRAYCDTPSAVTRRVETIAERYGQPALVEEYLPGREFVVCIVGNGAGARALPLVEKCFGALPVGAARVSGHDRSWLRDTPERPLPILECPAPVDMRLNDAVVSVALSAYNALRCRDCARVDVRLDAQGLPHVLEVNPLPELPPDPAQSAVLPRAARAAGLEYGELIRCVLDIALARYGMTR